MCRRPLTLREDVPFDAHDRIVVPREVRSTQKFLAIYVHIIIIIIPVSLVIDVMMGASSSGAPPECGVCRFSAPGAVAEPLDAGDVNRVVSNAKENRMHRLIHKLSGSRIAHALIAAGLMTAAVSNALADGITPPTPLRQATQQDIVSPLYPTQDFLWWSIQDPNGPAKVLITAETAALNVSEIAINVTKPDGTYANLSSLANPFTRTTLPSITTTASVLSPSQLDFRYVPEQNAYHLTFNTSGMSGDLWFTNNQFGAAMQPAIWDSQQVFWTSTIGRTDINGWVQFAGDTQPTTVTEWQGEEERMAGNFVLLPGHKGYEYAQTSNPDGSADQLFVFPQIIDGTWRGLYSHLNANGTMTYCEPDVIQLSNYQTTPKGFAYPSTIYAKCTAANVDITYTVTQAEEFPLPPGSPSVPLNLYPGFTTMSAGHSNVPGSVGTIQHLRNLGFYGT